MASEPREIRLAYKDRTFDIRATYLEAPQWKWTAVITEIDNRGQEIGVVGQQATGQSPHIAMSEALLALTSAIDIGEI